MKTRNKNRETKKGKEKSKEFVLVRNVLAYVVCCVGLL
jgi:hypothetical protein